MTKITFIGAGSVIFTKNLLGDILSFPELQDCTIALHDIDPVRLDTAVAMAHWTGRTMSAHPTIEAHLNRRPALAGAQYVINMIQVGGHPATLIDFEIPRRYGFRQTIGDTNGVGAIFRALRTLPVMLDLAADMQAECPGALLLNYTNPMSILCWGVYAASQVPVVGLCHSVQGTTRQMASYVHVPYQDVTFLGAGINHMAWILRFQRHGEDLYPLLRNVLEENRIPDYDLVRAEMFRRLGYYMTESSEHLAEYLSYFIPHAGQVEKFNIPIDEYLRRSEKNQQEFDETRLRLQNGEAFEIQRSAEYASVIIHSMQTGEPAVIYGNVRNTGLIENLPSGSCVEVPCLVDGNGIQPTHIGQLPPQLAGINRQHISVHELVVRAVLEKKRDYIYQAAMLDPLASSSLTLADIHAMVTDLLEAHGPAMPEGFSTTQENYKGVSLPASNAPTESPAGHLPTLAPLPENGKNLAEGLAPP